jgi:hypothetical protein
MIEISVNPVWPGPLVICLPHLIPPTGSATRQTPVEPRFHQCPQWMASRQSAQIRNGGKRTLKLSIRTAFERHSSPIGPVRYEAVTPAHLNAFGVAFWLWKRWFLSAVCPSLFYEGDQLVTLELPSPRGIIGGPSPVSIITDAGIAIAAFSHRHPPTNQPSL